MKTMMKTTMKATMAGVALVVLGTLPLSAQRVVVPTAQSCDGVLEGHLGIGGLDCVGECSMSVNSEGGLDRWDFSTEPRIFAVEAGGPSDGIFEPGDRLVAIDGALITTRQGGRRYGNLVPGEVVTVRYRRNGVIREAAIRVGSRCRPNPPEPARVTGRVTPPPPPRPDREPRTAIATAPRVRVLPDVAVEVPTSPELPAIAGTLSALSLFDTQPTASIGIGYSCHHCGTDTDQDTGENIWFFTGPVEVTQVNSGGPAEDAGIRMGDLITAIDGHEITSEEGGRAFSRLTPGESVRITLTRRNGREEDVSVVPEEARTRVETLGVASPARPLPTREPRAVTDVAVSRAVERPERPELATSLAGPEDLPVSYSGTVGGVEVLVRGGPVFVSEMEGARTLLINADGLWIRIRVPAGIGRSGGSGEGGR